MTAQNVDQKLAQPVEIEDYAIASRVPLDAGALEIIKERTERANGIKLGTMREEKNGDDEHPLYVYRWPDLGHVAGGDTPAAAA